MKINLVYIIYIHFPLIILVDAVIEPVQSGRWSDCAHQDSRNLAENGQVLKYASSLFVNHVPTLIDSLS